MRSALRFYVTAIRCFESSVGHLIIIALLILLGLLLSPYSLASIDLELSREPIRILGRATNTTTGATVYKEAHHCDKTGHHCLVQYSDNANAVFFQKYLNMSQSLVAPDYIKVDRRSGDVQFGVTSDTAVAFYQLENVPTSRLNFESTLGKKIDLLKNPALKSLGSVTLSDSLIVDAGFDQQIKKSWSKLITDGRASFYFAVPSRGEAVTMNIAAKSLKSCIQDVQLEYRKANTNLAIQCFSVTTKSWLYSLFFKSISLAYDADTRQLLSFKGLSGIKSAEGKLQNVLIQYRYPE